MPAPHSPTHTPSETRQALLDAAEELFSAKGYAAVGIREISDQARANIAAIKYHFGSKSQLYAETVRRAMSRDGAEAAWDVLRDPRSKSTAAAMLVRFIHMLLARQLGDRHCSACNLMLREAAEPSEAFDAVTRHYMQPRIATLMHAISVICPDADSPSLALIAQSILGQIMHYRVCRPFIERMQDGRRQNLSDPARIREIADHVARFSLRAMGCSASRIENAIDAAKRDFPAKRKTRTSKR